MGTKQIDIKAARTLAPVSNILSPEPDLRTLLRSKATDGPLAGAWIEAPYNWDGICAKAGTRIRGRYKWDSVRSRWYWAPKGAPEAPEADIETIG